MGAPEEVILKARKDAIRNTFKLSPSNEQAYDLFRNLSADWKVIAGLGGAAHLGIPVTSIESIMRTWRIPLNQRKATLEQIKLLENGAAPVLNER